MTQPPNLPPQNPAPILNDAQTNEGIREIASRQKAILLCILVNICIYAGFYLAPPTLRPLFSLGVIVIDIVAAVFVFMLAIKIYGTALGIFLGILTLIPCIGLLALLIVNGKATTLLRAAGLKVGLFGANVPKDFHH